MFKITFCTAIKNRLHHLEKTLVRNIDQNCGYENLQFLILDYNSNDGLELWMKNNMASHIKSGRVVYYRTEEPAYFHRTHSRNMAFTLAEGDLVCNIDADNFTGSNFAEYLNIKFGEDNVFAAADDGVQSDYLGRVCCKKTDFLAINGYDERMEGYGFEDLDFQNRLLQSGLKKTMITDCFLEAVVHDNHQRISDEKLFHQLKEVYISHVTPSQTDIIFLFNNMEFSIGRLINCTTINSGDYQYALKPVKYEYMRELSKPYWTKGRWQITTAELKLEFYDESDNDRLSLQIISNNLVSGNKVYHKISNKESIIDLLLLHSQLSNRYLMKENMIKKAKHSPIGTGVVFKNFQTQPIYINQ